MITGYEIDKIMYGLIVFGNTATFKIQFINVTNIDDLINFLAVVTNTKGSAACAWSSWNWGSKTNPNV